MRPHKRAGGNSGHLVPGPEMCKGASRVADASVLVPRLRALGFVGKVPARLGGASPSGKAADFESAIPRFESWRPSQASSDLGSGLGRRRKTDSRGFPFPGSPFGEPDMCL